MLIGTEPVSVDLSSTTYFVKDFGRKELEADDQFHNHISRAARKVRGQDGSYSLRFAVRAVISDDGSRLDTVWS
jgi:hypothetical protein